MKTICGAAVIAVSVKEENKLFGRNELALFALYFLIINLLSHSDSQDWGWLTSGLKNDFSEEL